MEGCGEVVNCILAGENERYVSFDLERIFVSGRMLMEGRLFNASLDDFDFLRRKFISLL